MNNYLKNKKNALFVHSKVSAWKRYRLKLNKKKYEEMNAKLLKGSGILIQEQSNNRKIFCLDNKYKLVFDTLRGCIITFLPDIKEENLFKVDRSNKIELLSGEFLKI